MRQHSSAEQTVPSESENRERLRRLSESPWSLLIEGRLSPAESGATYQVEDPYTEDTIALAPDASVGDVGRAIAGAREAAAEWRNVPALERGECVHHLADELERHLLDFAVLDAASIGAPVTVMHNDAVNAIKALRHFAGLASEVKGQTIPASNNLHFTVREPYGVVARILAYNHPFLFAVTKLAAPLVAGNATVLKPPDIAPLSALLLGTVLTDVLPPSVASVVVGEGPEVPRAIVRDERVRRIGFVGSEPTGRAILRDAAETGVTSVSLELGGKNALLALPDAPVEQIAEVAVRGMNFSWSGQSCMSTSRLFVHESVADDVINRVVERLQSFRFGPPLDPSTTMGTIASRAQYEKVTSMIERAVADGAVVCAGGGRPEGWPVGQVIEPTVLDAVEPRAYIAQEEVFGPVLSVIRWRDLETAIEQINSTRYGLTTSILTRDIDSALGLSRAIDVGYVWINGAARLFPSVPFGGVKDSGLGREEGVGELLSYTTEKSINVFLANA